MLKNSEALADLNSWLARDPIIFANPAFAAITGYQPEEFLGRNCRFLQGRDTDPVVLEKLRDAVHNGRPFHGTLLNYRKDGTPFRNELTISPVRDEAGNLMNLIGLQTDVTEQRRIEMLRDNLTHMIVHDLHCEDSLACVSVRDDGPGIPKEYHGRIFDKFGQVESHRSLHSTGLGLTFCKLGVEAHRGTICVESEPGEGSTFTFTLPLTLAGVANQADVTPVRSV